MSTITWKGDAVAVLQETRATPANANTGDTYTLTCAGESVSFTVAGTETVAAVTAGLTSAWNNSTAVEHEEVTASDEITHVKFVPDTSNNGAAGKPFVITGSVADGGSGAAPTLTMTTPTANAGPNCWDTADNWSGAAVPVNSDDVIIENSTVSILYGLAQSAVTLDSLTVRQNYTGTIGLPRTNSPGGYIEYRETYLELSATAVSIGQGDGTGSGRIKLNTGSVQATINVYGTGSALESTLGAFLWKGTHASNVLNVNKGTVGVAMFGGEAATILTLGVGYTTNISGDAWLSCGSGTTLTTVNQSGGELFTASNMTTVTQTDGEHTVRGTATVTTYNLDGGKCFYESSGTLTTLYVGGGAEFDCRHDMRSRTITNCTAYQDAVLRDPFKTVAWTNGIDLSRCGPLKVTLDIGEHFTLTPSAI